jgi:hypothetical protein
LDSGGFACVSGREEELLTHDTQMPPDAQIRWLRIRVLVVAVLATARRIESVTVAVYRNPSIQCGHDCHPVLRLQN